MAERKVRVKLVVKGVKKYERAIRAAAQATRELAEAQEAVESLLVRSDEPHGLPAQEATVDQWEVEALPLLDFAAKALREAQEKYERDYPKAKMSDLIWKLRKRNPNG